MNVQQQTVAQAQPQQPTSPAMQQAQAAVAAAGWYPGYMMPGVGMPGMAGVPATGAAAAPAGVAPGGTVVAAAGPVPATGFAPGFDSRSCRGLYVGNLDTKVTDMLLYEIFSTIGLVESCKVIKDKNGISAGYGFVDYYDHETADRALTHLNGRKIYNSEIKVNWAYAGGQRGGEEAGATSKDHYHIFVGDLSPEIDDKALFKAFSAFGTISDARVMWDQNTGRSRGYGFVAFRSKQEAERALQEMNGEWLGNRAIRCNWANQKQMSGMESNSADYETVFNQSPPTNTTVYVGNLAPEINEPLVRSIFNEYGFIEEVRMQKDKGYAFLRYSTHEQAAKAITGVNGRTIGSKAVKCSWGKERSGGAGGVLGPSYPAAAPSYPAYYQPGVPPTYYAQPSVYNQQYYGSAGYGQQYQQYQQYGSGYEHPYSS